MSGAMVVELFLEEAGIDYERVIVAMAAGEHRSAEYLSEPNRSVSVSEDCSWSGHGERAMRGWEHYPEAGLVPQPRTPDRPAFLRWLIYMAASPYMTFVQFNHPERFLDEEHAHGALIENARSRLLSQFSFLDAAIAGTPYFLPDRFSVRISTSLCSWSSSEIETSSMQIAVAWPDCMKRSLTWTAPRLCDPATVDLG